MEYYLQTDLRFNALTMNRLRTALLLIPAFLMPWFLAAQYWELGLMGGVSHYQGDIPTAHMGLARYQPATGVQARYQMSPWFSVRMYAHRATLAASDPLPSGSHEPAGRNLAVRTDVYEAGVLYEWAMTGFSYFDGRRISPFLFTGFQFFHFNPRARFQGQWMDLQPLGTEGQTMYGGKGYHRIHPAIPLGLGFRVGLSPRVSLAAEFGVRLTFTDYLDDVSGAYPDLQGLYMENPMAARLSDRSAEQAGVPVRERSGTPRGNPRDMDRYFVAGISLGIHLGRLSRMEFDPAYKGFLDGMSH